MTNGESVPNPGAPPPQERRKSPRVNADMPVSVSNGEDTIAGRVKDICLDAFLMEGETSFRRDTDVSVELHLSEATPPVAVRGKVVRLGPTRPGVMAVMFRDPDRESTARIKAFVESLHPTPPAPTTTNS
jgi:hypothetical protein